MNAPQITGAANGDDQSVDITLAAMPAGATAVDLYGLTATGYDQLLSTWAAPGTYNDDNAGAGFPKWTMRKYVAVANDGAVYSPPSRDLLLQVGIALKYSMDAHITNVAYILANDPTLQGFDVDVRKYYVDPSPVQDTIYVLPEVEQPDQPYANQRLETTLPIKILVTTVSGDGRTAWAHNHALVEQILYLLRVHYKWGCNAYDSNVDTVDYNAEQEGWQPENPVAAIYMSAHSQYARFIGA